MSVKRVAIFLAVMAGLAAFAVLYPSVFIFSLVTTITVIYTAWGVYHVAITISGLKPPLNPDTKLDEFPKISAIIPARKPAH